MKKIYAGLLAAALLAHAAGNGGGEGSEAGGTAGAETSHAIAQRATVYVAERHFLEARELLLSRLSQADPRVAVSFYGDLAAAGIGLGNYGEAEDYARRGVDLSRQVLPEGHPLRAALLNNLAQACRLGGNYMEAEKDYREALDIWESAVGPAHPDYGRGLMNLAALYHERGREAGAEQLYLRAAEVLSKAEPVLALVARNELADVLRAQLRYTESEKLARTTLRQLESALQHDDPRVIRARFNWATLLQRKVVARAVR